ncbi:MAG TPA: helix-turn-helix domain-containing protein [Kofleriaceae bacterium]|nr:helix-turn-helix domain-containing protein [Kofleriaceae bacterium]
MPVSSRDAQRRREILDAAQTCFLRFGYGKTSLDDIAQTAKLSRPLLYRKFANKEAIFAALYDDVFQAKYRAATPIAASRASKAVRLTRMCEVVCIEPYALIMRAPMADEFWAACERVIPEVLEAHETKWRALLREVLPRASADVFALALEGLWIDAPSVAVLRARIRILIQQFVR